MTRSTAVRCFSTCGLMDALFAPAYPIGIDATWRTALGHMILKTSTVNITKLFCEIC